MADNTYNDLTLGVTTEPAVIDFGSSAFRQLTNGGGATQINVNGSVTPVVFEFGPANFNDPTKDAEVREVKIIFEDNSFRDNGFMSINGGLTNGILIEIKSNNNMFTFLPLRFNRHFYSRFAFGAGSRVDILQGNNATVLAASFLNSIVLREAGAFGPGNDDYIRLTVRDNLTAIEFAESTLLVNERDIIA